MTLRRPSRVARKTFARPRALLFGAVCLFLLSTAPLARADSLTVNVANGTQSAAANAIVTFRGTITNTTGADLRATDLFFDFFGFNPAAVTDVSQLLGSTDFVIANGATSALVDLFSVTLGAGAVSGQTYSVGFLLQSANGDLSSAGNVNVTRTSPSSVPEPATLLLLGTGLAGLALRKRSARHAASKVLGGGNTE